jgi:hypothetical protein
LNTLSYEATEQISKNIHTASSAQLLPLTTNTEETHEALNAAQVSTSWPEQLLIVHGSLKNIQMFPCKPTTVP